MENSINALLQPEIQAFIQQNLNKNSVDLMLKKTVFSPALMPKIVEQIACLQKTRTKIPTWFANKRLIYSKLSIEQCSSEITAKFKSEILNGESLADLTGGLGVDTYFFAQKFKKVIHIEPNVDLHNLVKHNFRELGISNADFFVGKSEDFLSADYQVDSFFIDPSRRDGQKNKIFRLEDCEPNILDLMPQLLKGNVQVLLKTSPMLDIDLAIRQLEKVHKIWVLAVENEVKEVLYLLKNNSQNPDIETINFKNENILEKFTFSKSTEELFKTQSKTEFSLPLKYLYEPNAAILKAGAFVSFGKYFNFAKLQINSHLYTSEILNSEIPARVFEVLQICKYDKKEILHHLPEGKANLTTRNFPASVSEIRQKLNLKEGGNDYLFATTDLNNKPIIIICRKIK